MIKFYLYSIDYPKGKKIAEVADESSANVLIAYYNGIYDKDIFLVTIKRNKQVEKEIIGSYSIQ